MIYRKTSTLKSKPKPQRWIIADILLAAEKPLTLGEIVAQARKADYEETFKRGKQKVTVEESVTFHLDEMMGLGMVKAEMQKVPQA
jgi:hypothetical protein